MAERICLVCGCWFDDFDPDETPKVTVDGEDGYAHEDCAEALAAEGPSEAALKLGEKP